MDSGGRENAASEKLMSDKSFKTKVNLALVRLRAVPPEVWIFLIYFAVTVFLTWPLVSHFTTSIYGKPGDNLGAIWLNWWYKNAAAFGGKASYTRMLGYPFGTALSFPVEPLGYIWARFLLLFTSDTVAWNIDIFLSFLVSGVTMYYLVRYLTRDRRVAFFGGLAYLVGVFHAYYAMWIGGGLATTQWMPLYILLLLKFMKRPTWKGAAWLAFGGVLVASTSIHFGFFMGIFTAAFLVGYFLYKRISAARREGSLKGLRTHQPVNTRTLAMSLTVVLVVLVFILPFFTIFVLEFNTARRWPTSQTPEELRSPQYVYYNAAKPGEYLVPSTLNPVFGPIAKKFAGSQQPNFANSIYVGWTVIVLCLVCALLWRGRRLKKDGLLVAEQESLPPPDKGKPTAIIWGFLVAGAVAFVFSLKPYVMIGSVKIPLPSKLFSIVAPWFRWYNRLAIVVSICLIVVACYGLQRLLSRLPSWKTLIIVIVAVLVTIEMIMVPPFINFSFQQSQIPPVFKAVKNLPKGSALAFYPMKESGPFITSRLMFYQTEFQKPMINGGFANSDGEAMRRTVYNPYDPQTPGVLRRLGIGYMVFFMGQIEGTDGQRQDPALLPPGFKEVLRFNGKGTFEFGRMYKVTAPPADVVLLYLGAISVPYIEEGGHSTRLIDQSGDIKLLNYSGRDRKIALSIPLSNPYTARDVAIETATGQTVWKGRLERDQAVQAVIRDLDLPRAGTDLTINVMGQPFPVSFQDLTIFGATQASLMMGDVKIIDAP